MNKIKFIKLALLLSFVLSLTSCSKSELEAKVAEIEALTAEKTSLKEENEKLKTANKDLEKELENLKKVLDTQSDSLKKLDDDLKSLKAELKDALKAASEAEALNKTHEDEKKSAEAKKLELSVNGKKFEDFYKANIKKGINGMALLRLAELAFDMSFKDAGLLDIGKKIESNFDGGKNVQYNNNLAFYVGAIDDEIAAIEVSNDFNSEMMGLDKKSIHTMFGEPQSSSQGEETKSGQKIDSETYSFNGYGINIYYEKKGKNDIIGKVIIFK